MMAMYVIVLLKDFDVNSIMVALDGLMANASYNGMLL